MKTLSHSIRCLIERNQQAVRDALRKLRTDETINEVSFVDIDGKRQTIRRMFPTATQ